jgi:hypothetical protein
MKTKKLFPQLSKVITDTNKVGTFIDKLIVRVKENNPISDNPMIDGMIIGWMLKYKTCLEDMIVTQYHLGRLLDSTIQKLEQITIWITNNEDKLIEIYEN